MNLLLSDNLNCPVESLEIVDADGNAFLGPSILQITGTDPNFEFEIDQTLYTGNKIDGQIIATSKGGQKGSKSFSVI